MKFTVQGIVDLYRICRNWPKNAVLQNICPYTTIYMLLRCFVFYYNNKSVYSKKSKKTGIGNLGKPKGLYLLGYMRFWANLYHSSISWFTGKREHFSTLFIREITIHRITFTYCKTCYLRKTMRKLTDKEMIGRQFNRWTILHRDVWDVRLWLCRCECGTVKAIRVRLTGEMSGSCGCLRREVMRAQHNRLIINSDSQKQRGIYEFIRKKYGNRCQNCGMTKEECILKYREVLSVHHIDGDHENDDEENMIPYCKSCHMIIEGIRRRAGKALKVCR